MNPFLSIITVNFNNLKGLQLTISNVMGQSFQDFEYIIIDGGSKDGSMDYVKAQKELIHHWISEPDKGVYHAMNKGVAAASGDYLLFLNSGDHFNNPKSLEKAIPYLGSHDIVYFDLNVVEDHTSTVKTYPDELSFSYFLRDTLPHPASFIRKKVFSMAGCYNDDLQIVADWKFFMDAICKFQCSYNHVSVPVSTFDIGGMSSRPENFSLKMKERQDVINNEYLLFAKDLDSIVELKNKMEILRSSRKINLLIKLGLINNF